MTKTTLFIKNMVCPRCIKTVEEELGRMGLKVNKIELGKVEIEGNIEKQTLINIENILNQNGFKLIDDKRLRTIEKIKTLIIEIIHHGKEVPLEQKISDFIASELVYDYSYLSKLFSSIEDTTIEKYIINQRLERVKELLTYDELSLKEISYQSGFSSAQHLSSQFKKITGFSPSEYKKQKLNQRNTLDNI